MITKEQVYEALHECYDPEIPVNIVDLGLVYDVQVDEGDNVAVKMTLTAPGCGMGTMIAADARQRILALEGVGDATVDLVWEPPWNPSMPSNRVRTAASPAPKTVSPPVPIKETSMVTYAGSTPGFV